MLLLVGGVRNKSQYEWHNDKNARAYVILFVCPEVCAFRKGHDRDIRGFQRYFRENKEHKDLVSAIM